MRTVALTGLAAACAMAGTAVAQDRRYTVADLEALVAQKSYREALAHAADVAPADRKAAWVDVTAAAAGALLTTVEPEAAILMIDELDREYPALLAAAKYTKPRNAQGPKGLAVCFQREGSVDACFVIAQRFVEHTKDAAVTLAVAKLARASGHAAEAVPLFERVIAGSKTGCKDADAKLAVIAGLGLPGETATATTARALATTCYAEMKTELLAAFDQASDGYVGKNTCELLSAKKAISGLQQQRCRKPR